MTGTEYNREEHPAGRATIYELSSNPALPHSVGFRGTNLSPKASHSFSQLIVRPAILRLSTSPTVLAFVAEQTLRVAADVSGSTESTALPRVVLLRSARHQPRKCRSSRCRFASEHLALGSARSDRPPLPRTAPPSARRWICHRQHHAGTRRSAHVRWPSLVRSSCNHRFSSRLSASPAPRFGPGQRARQAGERDSHEHQ